MKKQFDPYDFSKRVVDGVPVYYKKFPNAPCVHVRVCFNVGCLNDPKDLAGISHFLEHMIFDGCPSIKTKKDVVEWSKKYTLDSWNAWTWFTNTNYHLRCLPENLDKALVGMKDMIFNPYLRAEDVEHERKVITEEAWGVYKNEKYLKYHKEVLDNFAHGTAQAKTSNPLGWPKTIKKISQHDLKEWHTKNYGKGNFFMVVSGNINDNIFKKVERFVADIPKSKQEKLNFGALKKPKKNIITKNSSDIGDPREQAEITIERSMYTKDSLSEEVQNITASLLHDILFERLRTEKALCYGVRAGSHIQKNLTGWHINVMTKEENVEIVKKEIWKAIDNITAGKEKNRFDDLKRVGLDRLKSKEEVTNEVSDYVLACIWRFNKVTSKKSKLKEKTKISYKDVVSCLKETFKKEWVVTETILPKK